MMPSVLDSLKVKGMFFKNRLVMPPIQGDHATIEGGVTDKLLQFYKQRAEALGLIIVEHSYVSLHGQLSKRQLGIYDDHLVPGLRELVKRIQPYNTRIVLQLNHAGAKAPSRLGVESVSASPLDGARELRTDEIQMLPYTFGRAAERAIKAGFDGVEIHGAHGFLLNQFYSPITNQRTDEYGGSLDNRIRLPIEVVREVKKKIGTRLLLYRLGSVDLALMGTQINDSQFFAKALVNAGVDIVDISGGLCGGAPAELAIREGFFVPQAEAIKAHVDVPVIGVGGVKTPRFANQVIRDERVDFIAVGRALRKDPDWAIKAVKYLKAH
ncbi:MAG: NADH:flavin oxidoreductase [Promethearchaeota archaeon]